MKITGKMIDAMARAWMGIDTPLENVHVPGGDQSQQEWVDRIRSRARLALEAALRESAND